MEQAAATAAYEALHEAEPYHDGTFQSWSKVRSADYPYKFDEGVAIGVAREDPAPWDQFTTKRNASPVRPEGWGSSSAKELESTSGEHTSGE